MVIPENECTTKGEIISMTIDKDLAMKLWGDVYGNVLWATDCFGTYIYRDDYGDYDKKRLRPNGTGKYFNYGWDVDHIKPKAAFSNENNATFMNNLQPLHHSNNLEKSDGYPTFTVKNQPYRIVSDNHGGYGIIDKYGHRVDWKKDGRHY